MLEDDLVFMVSFVGILLELNACAYVLVNSLFFNFFSRCKNDVNIAQHFVFFFNLILANSADS